MLATPIKPTLRPWIAYVLTLLTIELIFGGFFATTSVGHDYSFFMPSLLDGYYWFLNNGIFSPEWFSPAFCAGIPTYADPQSLYYSPLQFLSFIVPPLMAAHLTLLLYTSLGYLGMYLLCRKRLHISMAGSILAAVLWMLNGFVTHRMIIGHVTFVAIALIPLVGYLILTASARWQARCLSILGAGLLIASWVYSALGALLVPAALSVFGLLCIAAIRSGSARTFYINGTLAALVGVMISASKLSAIAALMSNLPRSQYPLMGFGTIHDLLLANLASIALPSAWAQLIAWPLVQNRFVYLDIHEWTLTLTPVPLLLITCAAIALAWRHYRQHERKVSLSSLQYIHFSLLALILILPFSIQFYTPDWSAVLKQLPIIKSTSNPFRWTVLWLPLICVTAALALDTLVGSQAETSKRTWILGITACLIVGACVALEPREFYKNQGYDPTPVTQAYKQAQQSEFQPRVEKVGAHMDENKEVVLISNRNDLIVSGISQAFCYNPLFGYGLETFDPRDLGPGAMARDLGGHLNMKNPACYVFPEENQCAPGDHYLSNQKAQAEQLMQYRPLTFLRPLHQRIADALSLITLILALILGAFSIIRLPKK
jgi:hypothetical protein